MNNKEAKHILVVFGGASEEHWVSLRSAMTVLRAITNLGHYAYALGITKAGKCLPYFGDFSNISEKWEDEACELLRDEKHFLWQNISNLQSSEDNMSKLEFGKIIASWYGREAMDLVFPVLHGSNGEDGIFQGLMTFIQWPYVGCLADASHLGMNKILAKLIWEKEGLPVLPWLELRRSSCVYETEEDLQFLLNLINQKVGLPAFIKPVNGGSSIGVSKIKDISSLREGLITGFSSATNLLVEPYVEAIEYEVGLLGSANQPDNIRCSAVCEIVKDDIAAYTFFEKYLENKETKVNIPAKLSKAEEAELYDYAKKAFISIGGRHLSRMDFFKDIKTNKFYLNEINTLPGFTPTSLYAKGFLARGISLEELIADLINLAVADGFTL